MQGVPFTPTKKAMDAETFFAKMAETDTKVAAILNARHEKRVEGINAKRLEPPPLNVGAKVWYRPERQPGTDKLSPEWKGPAIILERQGKYTYVVELRKGNRQKAHRSQLRPHVYDQFSDAPYPLYYHVGKAPEVEARPGEYNVEKVLKQRTITPGKDEVLIKWEGFEKPTWEPVVALMNAPLMEFCREEGWWPSTCPME